MTTGTQTVREIALQQPASMRIFEQYGIDYYCGGDKPLAEACEASQVELGALLAALESAAAEPAPVVEDWSRKTLEDFISHIIVKHHVYVRKQLPRLTALAEEVVNRYGAAKPELPAIQAALAKLGADLLPHLTREETKLFPYIIQLERAHRDGTLKPAASFGTIARPIEMLLKEHDAARGLTVELQQLSQNFTVPEDADPTFHAFYDGLKEFVLDLHQHIHLENNLLFPRAAEME